jgi:hypothetical protein
VDCHHGLEVLKLPDVCLKRSVKVCSVELIPSPEVESNEVAEHEI